MQAIVHPLMGWISTAPATGVKKRYVEKSIRLPPGPGNAAGVAAQPKISRESEGAEGAGEQAAA